MQGIDYHPKKNKKIENRYMREMGFFPKSNEYNNVNSNYEPT